MFFYHIVGYVKTQTYTQTTRSLSMLGLPDLCSLIRAFIFFFFFLLSLICVAVKAGWMFRQLVLKVRAVFLDSDLELVFFHGV